MEAYLLDWANLLLRWLHVITAIAWIGSSFYFVFLDNNLIRPTSPDLLEKGVDGAMWAVHGGGFYNPQKYMVAPRDLPRDLHWFYWESYWTWMSGFALFVVETDQMVSGYRHGDHLLRRHRRHGVLRPRVWVILDAL